MRSADRVEFGRVRWLKRLAPLLPAAAVILIGLAAQSPIYDRSVVPMDEGHLASAADWILRGKLLYRDIHTGIFPAIYYLTALLFSLTSPDMVVTRWAQVGVNVAIALCLWLLGSRVMHRRWAALPPLLHLTLVVISFPVLTMLNYSALSLSFGLASLLFLLRYLEAARTADGIILGALLAACALTKQNFGVLVLLAILIGLFWGRSGTALQRRSWVSALWPIATSGGLLALATVAYFASAGTLVDLLDATVFSLGPSQLQSFNNPIPPLIGAHPVSDGRFVFLYSPPMLFNYLLRGETILGQSISPFLISLAIRLSYGLPLAVLAIAPAVLWLTRSACTHSERRGARTIVVFASLFLLGIFPSAIWSHLAFVLPPVLLVVALIGDRIEGVLVRQRRLAAWVWKGFCISLVIGCGVAAASVCMKIRAWYAVPLDLPRASLLVSERQAALLRGATGFIERCADPMDQIFVAPDLPVLYFLTGRFNPTPYDLTIPGSVDGHLIVERLKADQTRCIVYNPRMYLEFPPFDDLFPELSRYLSTSYTQAEVIRGGTTVWYGLSLRRRQAP